MHKANIMKLSGSLFLHTFHKVVEDYKHFDKLYSSMQLIVKMAQFKMMVIPNLYGPIISNIGRALDYAPFRPGCRHVVSDFMGANHAPTAMILSATMMLRHLCATFDVINIWGSMDNFHMSLPAELSETSLEPIRCPQLP
ncbi:hypothetical protein EDC04DRAFT_2609163 [Pisolithus marmoratus]|nr:hypothetical protein EDC04DRAFT_2609163 [Pisolithus marmoratus]